LGHILEAREELKQEGYAIKIKGSKRDSNLRHSKERNLIEANKGILLATCGGPWVRSNYT
jgi:hypothetical protein